MTLLVSTIVRFDAKVDRRGPDECWPWIGARTGQGYGNFYWRGRAVGAHRVAKVIDDGLFEPPEGMEIDHLCENPSCVNPAHLEWVPREGRINSVRHQERRMAGRTECPNGHPITDDSFYEYTYANGRKYRACRKCRNRAATEAHRRSRQNRSPDA